MVKGFFGIFGVNLVKAIILAVIAITVLFSGGFSTLIGVTSVLSKLPTGVWIFIGILAFIRLTK